MYIHMYIYVYVYMYIHIHTYSEHQGCSHVYLCSVVMEFTKQNLEMSNESPPMGTFLGVFAYVLFESTYLPHAIRLVFDIQYFICKKK